MRGRQGDFNVAVTHGLWYNLCMEPRKPKKPGPAPEFRRRVSLYENDDGVDLLKQLKDAMGERSEAGVLRALIRKEAQLRGIQPE